MEAVLCNATLLAAPSSAPFYYHYQTPAKGFAGRKSLRIQSARVGVGAVDESVKLDDDANSLLLLQAAMKPKSRNWLHFFFFHRQPEPCPPWNGHDPDKEVAAAAAVPESVSSMPDSCPHPPSPCPSCCDDGRGEGNESKRIKLWKTPHFTAEKARMLHRQLRDSETWHDAMYHSSIASRLATTHAPESTTTIPPRG